MAMRGDEGTFDFVRDPIWRIFRIMSEFVDGFSFLANVQRSVTIFGSARLPESHPFYALARQLGQQLAEHGYTVVTGGGPGIMQAANQGAFEAGGNSVGLTIELPHEERMNPYVRQSESFHYFFSRKVMLDFSAEAYIFFPGGFGTMDEFFELVTLVQTGKVERDVPIIMVGKSFWEPLAAWMRQAMLEQLHMIAEDDLAILTVTDDIDEIVHIVENGVRKVQEHRIATKGRAAKTSNDRLDQATSPMSGTEQ